MAGLFDRFKRGEPVTLPLDLTQEWDDDDAAFWSEVDTYSHPTAPTTRYSAPVSRPMIPASVSYRCLPCGHWFGSEGEFTAHVQFCCAGRLPAESIALGVQCECCSSLDETLQVKGGDAPTSVQ